MEELYHNPAPNPTPTPTPTPTPKVRGFVNLTHGLSEYLAAHPDLARPAALGFSQPFNTKPLALVGLNLTLPLGLPDSIQLAR